MPIPASNRAGPDAVATNTALSALPSAGHLAIQPHTQPVRDSGVSNTRCSKASVTAARHRPSQCRNRSHVTGHPPVGSRRQRPSPAVAIPAQSYPAVPHGHNLRRVVHLPEEDRFRCTGLVKHGRMHLSRACTHHERLSSFFPSLQGASPAASQPCPCVNNRRLSEYFVNCPLDVHLNSRAKLCELAFISRGGSGLVSTYVLRSKHGPERAPAPLGLLLAPETQLRTTRWLRISRTSNNPYCNAANNPYAAPNPARCSRVPHQPAGYGGMSMRRTNCVVSATVPASTPW
eukprot:366394-Chlamydomonas_euryale.AAC.5